MDPEYPLRKEWYLDIKTVSEANLSGEHWSVKRKRHILQKRKIWLWGKENNIKATTLPINIKLTRISPRMLDVDNLYCSFKWIKDYIADTIIPGLPPGQADSDPRIIWQYSQVKGKPKERAIKISFF